MTSIQYTQTALQWNQLKYAQRPVSKGSLKLQELPLSIDISCTYLCRYEEYLEKHENESVALSMSLGTAWNNRSQVWTVPFSSDSWKPNDDKLMLTLIGLAAFEQCLSVWGSPQLLRSLCNNLHLAEKHPPSHPLLSTAHCKCGDSVKQIEVEIKTNNRSTSARIVLFCVIFHSRKKQQKEKKNSWKLIHHRISSLLHRTLYAQGTWPQFISRLSWGTQETVTITSLAGANWHLESSSCCYPQQ